MRLFASHLANANRKESLRNMEPERRHAGRMTPDEVSYIQFEPDGGGIILNASEEGLAFHAAAPVRQSSPIRVCLSPNPEQRIELQAEIAWMDTAKKSGGLELKEVSADIRDKIRRWLLPSVGTRMPRMDFAPPKQETSQLPAISPVARVKTPDLLPPAVASFDISAAHADAAARSGPRLSGLPRSLFFPELPSLEEQASFSHPRRLRGFATVFLVFIFLLMPALFLQNFRLEFGNALIRTGEKLKQIRDTQPEPSGSIPVPVSAPSTRDASTLPSPDLKTPATEIAVPPPDQASPAQAAPAQTQPETISAEPNFEEHQAPLQLHEGRRVSLDHSELARRLWTAVEAGDSSAEVALAQLYLKGDGVPRNCEQARVLLRAASKKGSAEALQQYRKLNYAACR
jgi:hypothetical protein